MNREQAANKLNISLRSLQRAVAVEKKKKKKAGGECRLNVVYKRGKSGKREAVFDAREVAAYKRDRDQPIEYEQPPEPPESAALMPVAVIDVPTIGESPTTREAPATGKDSRQTQLVALVTAVREIVQATPAQLPPAHTEVSLSDLAVKPLLKLDEAARLTGLSRAILRDAIKAESLKAKLVGRAWRIKRSDLDAYIKTL
jgi:excisionase family DNA binding protein